MKNMKRVLALGLSLTMTAGLATFTASAAEQKATFADVSLSAPYATAVEALVEKGVMNGVDGTHFAPAQEVNRAQAITVLGRLAGITPVETNAFSDVVAGEFYAGYVGWAVQNGIVNGIGDGKFAPEAPVTSEQLNLMISRYAESIGKDVALYDTGAATVTRADLAQRLYALLTGGHEDTSVTLPVRAYVTSTGRAGCSADETAEEHAAHTSAGYIMGYTDRDIYTFMGIQYGTAKRFENPKPANVYGRNGVENLYSEDASQPTLAMVRGAASPQAKTNTVYSDGFGFAQYMTPSGSDMYGIEEECLNLNVWTDTMDSNAKKPVLVFMHGGGTSSDSANGLEVYDGHGFAEHNDIVFVSVNARLGVLGYNTDLTSIGGGDNLAVRDMLLSLEWVKENIATFGGDPDNVTILGQSGGGSKESYLIDSKYADDNNLFQKVVAISASLGSNVTATKETRTAAAESFVNNMKNGWTNARGVEIPAVEGFTAETTDAEVLAYLQSVRTDEISSVLSTYGNSGGAVIDGYIFDENSACWSSDTISDRAAQYTYLIGNTWSEMVGADSIEVIQYNMYDRAKAYLTEEQKTELLEAMRHRAAGTDWYGNEIKAATMKGTLEELETAFNKVFPDHDFYDLRTLVSGDQGGFTRDNYYNSSMRVGNSGATVYEYFMAYEFPYFGGTAMYHTGDLAFWFYSLGNVPYQIAGDEVNAYNVADFCSNALANFCKTGDPSANGITWLPHEDGNAHCMIIDKESRLVDGDYGAELIDLMTMIEN